MADLQLVSVGAGRRGGPGQQSQGDELFVHDSPPLGA